jgi:chemotaxis protein CheZ
VITQSTLPNGRPAASSVVDIDSDSAPAGTQLYGQLGELARFIDTTLKTINQFSKPMSATTEQLPEAATHLRNLRKLTEGSTHKIMQIVESIQDNHRRALRQLDEEARSLATSTESKSAALPGPNSRSALDRSRIVY